MINAAVRRRHNRRRSARWSRRESPATPARPIAALQRASTERTETSVRGRQHRHTVHSDLRWSVVTQAGNAQRLIRLRTVEHEQWSVLTVHQARRRRRQEAAVQWLSWHETGVYRSATGRKASRAQIVTNPDAAHAPLIECAKRVRGLDERRRAGRGLVARNVPRVGRLRSWNARRRSDRVGVAVLRAVGCERQLA